MKEKRPETPQQVIEICLAKWEPIVQQLYALIEDVGKPCGFCLQQDGCHNCNGFDKCQEMQIKFESVLEGTENYLLNDLMPWFKAYPGYTAPEEDEEE